MKTADWSRLSTPQSREIKCSHCEYPSSVSTWIEYEHLPPLFWSSERYVFCSHRCTTIEKRRIDRYSAARLALYFFSNRTTELRSRRVLSEVVDLFFEECPPWPKTPTVQTRLGVFHAITGLIRLNVPFSPAHSWFQAFYQNIQTFIPN